MREKKSGQSETALTETGRCLADHILSTGPVTVAEYMERALGHYYATQNPFGVAGDFTTAPEISQMFGEMIGAWLADIWQKSGKVSAVQLIELGPGRGTLMADILRTARAWPDFHTALSVHLVETSPALRKKQAQALGAYAPVWHDRLEDVPAGFSFVVANEFFDALPVHQYVMQSGEKVERRIGFDNVAQRFFFTVEGDVTETSPVSLAVMDEICRKVSVHGGAALIIDYGYTEGAGDSLQAISRHRYADIFARIGEQDLTAHVDFCALRERAEQNNMTVQGPVTQGEFLNMLGIAQRAEMLCRKATLDQQKDIMLALRRLTAPSEMGTLFKVLAVMSKKV